MLGGDGVAARFACDDVEFACDDVGFAGDAVGFAGDGLRVDGGGDCTVRRRGDFASHSVDGGGAACASAFAAFVPSAR